MPAEDRRRICADSLDCWKGDFASSGIKASSVSLEGHRAAPGLLKLAKEHDVDLIVAGTQSKSGSERLLLGSTAEQLIRNAECLVLTVGPNAKLAGDVPLAFQSIVYATDFSVKAVKAAAFALSFAQDSGARLYFCYVSSAPGDAANKSLDGAFLSALQKMIPESSYDWCSPECVVEHGDTARAILELANRVKADLIVLVLAGPRSG